MCQEKENCRLLLQKGNTCLLYLHVMKTIPRILCLISPLFYYSKSYSIRIYHYIWIYLFTACSWPLFLFKKAYICNACLSALIVLCIVKKVLKNPKPRSYIYRSTKSQHALVALCINKFKLPQKHVFISVLNEQYQSQNIWETTV